jgi:Na+/melibiose symporter-like transporter
VAPGEVDALRSKIASKLNVVSVLAGFTTAVMSAVLVQLLSKDDASSVAFAAVALYALAAILLVMSLLAYDQLTMPERFWAARRSTRRPSVLHTFPVARPPSSALRVLQQHAVRIWTSVVVALVIDALATWVLAAAALSPLGRWDKAALAVAAIVGVVVVCVWRDVFGPDLGVSD